MCRLRLFSCVLVLCASAVAAAQDVEVTHTPAAAGAPQTSEASATSSEGATSSTASPLAWWWKHSTPVPIVFYTPENLLGAGGGVMTTWVVDQGIENRPSNVIAYCVYTLRRQTILGASYELRSAHDRHVFLQELRFIDWPDRFYGIGNDTKNANREDYTDHYWQLESEYQVRATGPLFLGVRHQFRVSRTQDLDADSRLATERPLGVGRVLWSGAGPLVLWDSRKGLFWPEGGSYLRADVAIHRPWLGADFSAEVYRVDLRHYEPLWLHHVLALRLVTYGATGELPFQLLPSLGGSNLFRGWFLGRLRDRVLAAAEAEYRAPLSPRWALVAFGSVGRVAASVRELTPDALRAAGGAGVRFAVRPESRANFRLDIAYGDELYVYFQFREAF